MTLVASTLTRRVCLALVAVVVLARCAPILAWGDIYFDADEAVVGLMARHAAEGTAFPVFQYALKYVLMVEAWLAAPVMALADSSILSLKSVPVALNVATATLLYAMLTATPALAPTAALLAVAPFALPGEITAQELTEAIGMNIEPLMFTMLLWLLRERPFLLGVTAAVAVKNREFAFYAIAALIVVDLLRDRSARLWRGRIVALVAFALVWSGIEVLRLHSSPLGPHSSMAMLTDRGDNMSVAVGAMCIEPSLMAGDLWRTVTEMLPAQLGVVSDPRSMARGYGAQPLEAAWLWVPLVAVLAAGAGRGVLRAWRIGPSSVTWLGVYLMLTGAQAVVVYALTRCGHVSPFTMRYTLLSLFIPAGAIALALERETHRAVRAIVFGMVILWVGVSGLGHVTLVRALSDAQPQGTYRRLAIHLEQQGVRYIISDYWTGYNVAFLTNERITALTNFERVHDYTLAVGANLDRAVEVRRSNDQRCEGAATVAGFYICPPRELPHPP